MRLPSLPRLPKLRFGIRIRLNQKFWMLSVVILVVALIALGDYLLYRYHNKVVAKKAQIEHETTFQIICANGGRKYYRESYKDGQTGQMKLREGCR